MFPHSLTQNSLQILNYCERYINDGSPSGFTVNDQLIESTNPFSNHLSFQLYTLNSRVFTDVLDIGSVPVIDEEHEFFIHPMMLDDYKEYKKQIKKANFFVQPTSSGRTVVTCDINRVYIKLHFNDVLGRVNRAITYTKAAAGVEISELLEKGLKAKLVNNKVGLLREKGARVIWLKDGETSAYIYRDGRFWFRDKLTISFITPLFSLFSEDHKSYRNLLSLESSECINNIKIRFIESTQKLKENVVFPIIDLYFEGILNLGIQIEFNAQNVLVAFDDEFSPIGIILRDFSAVEKDTGFKSELWPDKFLSEPYKFINPDDENYQIRHSFAFDFKLTHYTIKPILDLLSNYSDSLKNDILKEAKERIKNWETELPDDFFPKKYWYSHPKVLLTGSRPYEKNENPLLRSK